MRNVNVFVFWTDVLFIKIFYIYFIFSLGKFVYMKVLPSPAKLVHPPHGVFWLANYSACPNRVHTPSHTPSQHALLCRVIGQGCSVELAVEEGSEEEGICLVGAAPAAAGLIRKELFEWEGRWDNQVTSTHAQLKKKKKKWNSFKFPSQPTLDHPTFTITHSLWVQLSEILTDIFQFCYSFSSCPVWDTNIWTMEPFKQQGTLLLCLTCFIASPLPCEVQWTFVNLDSCCNFCFCFFSLPNESYWRP